MTFILITENSESATSVISSDKYCEGAKMGGSEEDHPSYFVICFHRPCVQEAADFVVDSMVKPLEEGGAELIVRQEDGVDEKGKILGNWQNCKFNVHHIVHAVILVGY